MTPKETFTALADALFGEPKGFKLSEREFQGTTILVCNVKRQFYGRIIGGGGKVIQAFQIILGLAGRKAGKSHALQVLELDKDGKAERLPFVPDLNWDGTWLEKLACEVAGGIFKGKSYVELDDLPDGTSALRFFTVDKVPLPAAKVSEALGIIFRAIGKANGREVAVEFKIVD